jgi:hypothetical protein
MDMRTQSERVAEAMAATGPFTKERNRALAKLKWRMRAADSGAYAQLSGLECTLGPVDLAQVFDGRDDEADKLAFWERDLGCKLVVEVVP